MIVARSVLMEPNEKCTIEHVETQSGSYWLSGGTLPWTVKKRVVADNEGVGKRCARYGRKVDLGIKPAKDVIVGLLVYNNRDEKADVGRATLEGLLFGDTIEITDIWPKQLVGVFGWFGPCGTLVYSAAYGEESLSEEEKSDSCINWR